MTTTEARKIFDAAIAKTNNADAVAKIELVREFLTNPKFRARLEAHLWETRR